MSSQRPSPAHASPAPERARSRYYLRGALIVEHQPSEPVRAAAVLILPPLGYEDTSAYRPLRRLAAALAAAGHPVLRLDWPGLGDSAGSADSPGLVDQQLVAVRAATASLRERGAHEVVAVGARGGGLLALEAGGFDGLVLWGTPASGKALLREERAFHRMAARAFGAPPAEAPSLPAGAVEAGGFWYAAETVHALSGLGAPKGAPPRRALIIPREGASAPAEQVSALQAAGATVEVANLGGIGDLLEDPYRSRLAPEVEAALLGFVGTTAGAPLAPHEGESALRVNRGVSERAWSQVGGAGELSGVVCEPEGGAPVGATWTLFFNAGGVRRSGPNRLWTEAARQLAQQGTPSLRFDVRDVGDSDGATTPRPDLETMYSEDSVADALAAWDAVRALGAGQIDVVGLCSGAFLGAQVAARRPVGRALLFNGLAFVWNDEARANGMTSQIGRSLFDARRWQRLISGRIDGRALLTAIVQKGRLRGEALMRKLQGVPPATPVAELFRAAALQGARVELVSSEGDPSVEYLQASVPPGERPPLRTLPAVDHTIRPVWAHAKVLELITSSQR